MDTALNYRHSRRSACDRCRRFKLRCERDHMNDVSCERCLKAQVVCTTSVSQPAPLFLPSNDDPDPAQRGRHADDVDNDQTPLSALHRASNSKVSKTTFSSTTPRRQDRPLLDGRKQPAMVPFLTTDDLPQPAENMAQAMPQQGVILSPYRSCEDRGCPWFSDFYQLVSYIGSHFED